MEVVGYFKEHFQEVDWHRPTLDGLIFPTLVEGQRDDLEANFQEDELAAVIVDSMVTRARARMVSISTSSRIFGASLKENS
jgi:hypothetical protein